MFFGNTEDTKNYLAHLWNVVLSWLSKAFKEVITNYLPHLWSVVVPWLSKALKGMTNCLHHLWNIVVLWLSEAFSAAWKWISDKVPIIISPVTPLLKEHPYWAVGILGLIFLGPQILFLPLLIVRAAVIIFLRILGFGINGIVGGSPAARYQSLCYGGNIPSGSLFARFQSIGMNYHAVTLGSWPLAVVRSIAALVFLYVVFFVLW